MRGHEALELTFELVEDGGTRNAMKKSTRILLPVFSGLLLFVSVAVSAHAQIITGSIRWKKEMGVIPAGPGNSQAAAVPCGQFYVAAEDPQNGFKAVAYTDSPLTLSESGDYYICRYSFKVPENKSLYIVAGMGGVLLLPKEDRSPHYITAPWIGGSRSKPPAGYERSFTGQKYVTLRKQGRRPSRVIVNFELIYVNDNPR